MKALRQNRCFHHPQREAAAKCPSCQRHYCRECVSFVSGRMICSACWNAEQAQEKPSSKRWGQLGEVAVVSLSFLLVWAAIAGFGRLMASLPDPLHDATVWEELATE